MSIVAGYLYGVDEQARDDEHEEEVGAVVEDRGEGGLLVLEASLLAAGVSYASEYAMMGAGGLEVFEVDESLDDVGL